MQIEPDQELLKRDWRPLQRLVYDEPDFIYRKNGVYGWFDRDAAWSYQFSLEDGLIDLQYPTEVLPKEAIQ